MSESGLGKPTDDSTDSSKDLSCPECDKQFSSKHGVMTHHGIVHGGNIKQAYTCDECGKPDEKEPWRLEQSTNNFCSRQCYYNFQDKRQEVECAVCAEVVIRQRSSIKNHKNFFCSPACQSEFLMDTDRTVDTECDNCGVSITKQKHQYEQVDHSFCSMSCKGAFFTGQNSPLWAGGYDSYYGPNWDEQRTKARRRDNHTCQGCGSAGKLHTHHIKPISSFRNEYNAPEWWQKGNSLENLVCLCASCHRMWEGIPLKPDNR